MDPIPGEFENVAKRAYPTGSGEIYTIWTTAALWNLSSVWFQIVYVLYSLTLPGGADEGGGDDFQHELADGGRDVAVHVNVLALAVHGDAEEGHPGQGETRAGGVQGKHVAEDEMLVPLRIDDEEAGREVAEEDEPRGEDPGPPDAAAALFAETPAARLVGDGAAPGDGEAEGDDEGGDAKGDEGIVGGGARADVAGPHHPFEGHGGGLEVS
ncbi:unnamed protein product [Parascedosporium putredinis]|uniref:Uncharacterized protein n=1 Tax=Parascedosporium putredinis TaxID=1442378 RepID=A0A9P1MET2_9PEZI|nr:unnamed protein product [Parascedosporium putredinis]CAI8005169.1 unnamed protein product [Parascedosporium putredinis]